LCAVCRNDPSGNLYRAVVVLLGNPNRIALLKALAKRPPTLGQAIVNPRALQFAANRRALWCAVSEPHHPQRTSPRILFGAGEKPRKHPSRSLRRGRPLPSPPTPPLHSGTPALRPRRELGSQG